MSSARGLRGVPWDGRGGAGEREDGRRFSGVRGCSAQASSGQGRVDSIPARSPRGPRPVAPSPSASLTQ